MDKNAIKKYAIWARNELIARIAQKALRYGISKDSIVDAYADSIDGVLLSAVEKRQRQALIAQIEAKGFEQVVEEVAYTWFNRFCALRFMEVNGYLPSNIRVLSDEGNNFKPEILTKAIDLDFASLNMETVYVLKEANKDEELYRYLLIVQCNELNKILPHMFQKLEDYTELLLPDNLLRDGSVIDQLVTTIPQEDFDINQGGQVEIIGWLYQYYNTEPKAKTFELLKKNVKITKERIPSATQLFTPDWIVRYMVENSLGRIWIEGHSNDELKGNWKYYLDEAKQEEAVEAELAKIRAEYANLNPKDIKVIDPCMGSGHILVYAFDVLMQIYTSVGYTEKEAAISILENNLYGLDIDERAFQLAYFAVMMKARQYHKFILKKQVQCNLHPIVESNGINVEQLHYFGVQLDDFCKNAAVTQMQGLISQMHDAKEYGSIITVDNYDWDLLRQFVDEYDVSNGFDLFNAKGIEETQQRLKELIAVGEVLAKKYEVVVTNPPYMGSSNMNAKLSDFIKKNFADYKSDFFSAFMVHASSMTKNGGYLGFFTPYVWMFISSYEKLREFLCKKQTIETLIQFEYSAFEEATVPVCTLVFSNHNVNKKGCYFRLTDFRGGMEVQRVKTLEAIENHSCGYYYEQSAENFSKIPGSPIAYWVSEKFMKIFSECKFLYEIANPRQGLITGDVSRFVRKWTECSYTNLNLKSRYDDSDRKGKWFPYCNGGSYRKWYGNNEDVVNWGNNGCEIKGFIDANGKQRSRPQNQQYYFMEGGTWTAISSASFSIRYFREGFLFSNAGMAVYANHKTLLFLIAFLNSKLSQLVLKSLNEGMNYNQGDIAKLPLIIGTDIDNITTIVEEVINCSKIDWDAFENSWDFSNHPLVPLRYDLEEQRKSQFAETRIAKLSQLEWHYKNWEAECEERFNQLKSNEEELNRIFIDIYGLQDELTPEVEDKDVTVRKADLQREIKSLLSYAVGCMFGRYSLDVEGLAYAGGEWDDSKYSTFIPDGDNVIPITDDEYFEDDIVGRFINWLKVVYGEETLEENLQFIANALGGRGTAREVIRKYFVNDFFNDHCKIYQKRPIYWLFDSGKKNGFKALIYMHRYAPDTIARIRTDYVHEQQARYRTILTSIEQRLDNASTAERVKINKELALYKDKEKELHDYEEKIHHLADQMISIDLDDGVKNNYAIFGDVLAKIK